ncbi:hypothetical protein LSAT2_029104 [Lamellibrachia satsuma]|nr:hypothetical protein LSAT2_029104 [Lamellibrachia satsuma]
MYQHFYAVTSVEDGGASSHLSPTWTDNTRPDTGAAEHRFSAFVRCQKKVRCLAAVFNGPLSDDGHQMAAWLPGPRQPLVASAGLMDIRKRVPTVARGSFGFEETHRSNNTSTGRERCVYFSAAFCQLYCDVSAVHKSDFAVKHYSANIQRCAGCHLPAVTALWAWPMRDHVRHTTNQRGVARRGVGAALCLARRGGAGLGCPPSRYLATHLVRELLF